MAWTYLLFAGLFEVGYGSVLKPTQGFTKLWPTLLFLFCIVMSFLMLARAAREIPIGTAGTALVGILVYKEPATALRMICLATLIASIIGLRLATPT